SLFQAGNITVRHISRDPYPVRRYCPGEAQLSFHRSDNRGIYTNRRHHGIAQHKCDRFGLLLLALFATAPSRQKNEKEDGEKISSHVMVKPLKAAADVAAFRLAGCTCIFRLPAS